MKPGSVAWRFKNYGIYASYRYLYKDKLFKKFFESNNVQVYPSLLMLDKACLKLGTKQIPIIEQKTSIVLSHLEEKVLTFIKKGKLFKSNIVGKQASSTRLKLLAYLITAQRFELYCETGTQHGISAEFVSHFIENKMEVHTLDINKNMKLSSNPNIKYHILNTPVRKNFKLITKKIIKNKKIIFFHDSDHSYENMKFEFDWAWNKLNSQALVSDDIEGNNAFLEFAMENGLQPYFCKFDTGPMVGFVIRDF